MEKRRGRPTQKHEAKAIDSNGNTVTLADRPNARKAFGRIFDELSKSKIDAVSFVLERPLDRADKTLIINSLYGNYGSAFASRISIKLNFEYEDDKFGTVVTVLPKGGERYARKNRNSSR